MTSPPCPQSTENPLPACHFAILFEGAWVFTPEEGGKRILATCPLNDSMHKSEFGIWNNTDNKLHAVHGFRKTEFPCHTAFTIDIDPNQIVNAADSFSSLFRTAAAQYPFVYLPASGLGSDSKKQKSLKLRRSAIRNGRAVTIPMPSSLRAAGALLTAEVGGGGKSRLFGHELVVKRAFVTFLFLYEYRGSLKAEVCGKHKPEKPRCGHVIAKEGGTNPKPHLIFKVYPTAEGMNAMFSSSRTVMPLSGSPDQSTLKVHASTTFELLRQSIPAVGAGRHTPCCDMTLYHDQNGMAFDCGDAGLSDEELGLQKKGTNEPFGVKFPACAGGGMGAETSGVLDD